MADSNSWVHSFTIFYAEYGHVSVVVPLLIVMIKNLKIKIKIVPRLLFIQDVKFEPRRNKDNFFFLFVIVIVSNAF